MELDPLLLSRLQFAFVVSFHAIFPVFTIGLASYIALINGLFYVTKNPDWSRLAYFWTKVFAVAFGMGVVSGVVMSFQFGTNWSNFAYAASNFLVPVLTYEVITAFFLEAAFLGVLLFGRNKVPPAAYLFSAIMVAVGTFISSFWILSANSWMHTPAGYEMINGMVHVTSWSQAIFNPSFIYRFAHMVVASFLTGGFVVAGVSAWYLLRQRDVAANRRALSMCLWLLLVLTPLQAFIGDLHGINTLEHQPTKVAAMEGNWETQARAPLLIVAGIDQDAQENSWELAIPGLASLILKHDVNGVVPGLTEVSPDEQPNVLAVFWAFRVMVGLGFLMIAVALIGVVLNLRGRLYNTTWYQRLLLPMIAAPFIAVLAGWIVTEVGRSPWLIHNVMTHEQGVTPSLGGGTALFSLLGYMLVYGVVFSAGIYYLTRVVRHGMQAEPEQPSSSLEEFERPARPLSAADVTFDDRTDTQGA